MERPWLPVSLRSVAEYAPPDVGQITHRNSRSVPFHRWYPFLEGYSTGYVEGILDAYAPSATRILDPFGGTGTTPLVAAARGLTAYYCEINPVLQILTEAKSVAQRWTPRRRLAKLSELRELASHIDERLNDSLPDERLGTSYSASFGRSEFFGESNHALILRARTLLDRFEGHDPESALLFAVAICASLIPASRLIRAGDVRYRTSSELARGIEDFRSLVSAKLTEMADDLSSLSDAEPPARPKLVADDARHLADLDPLDIDAVITSPPYLNGTNYMRNAKLELWFLRILRSAEDLKTLRRQTVAAGINDVSAARKPPTVGTEVKALVEKLQLDAYDPRIPQLVAHYFSDMAEVFTAMQYHLRPGSIVAVDIGDSAFGGVRIKTDDLLVRIANDHQMELIDRRVLRTRRGRAGARLSQVLLVFRNQNQPEKRYFEAPLGPMWRQFKTNLPHKQPPYAKRNWGHSLHSLCSYQGKMKPALAHFLVECFAGKGPILDPFAGVGTIPLEAALSGVRSIGFEISPPAWVISSAKLRRPDRQATELTVNELERYINETEINSAANERARAIAFNRPLNEYFHPRTFAEVLLARQFFQEHQSQKASSLLVQSCLLHILHGNRPYALSRRSHPITPFAPTGEFEYRPLIAHLRDKLNRALVEPLPAGFVEGRCHVQDATAWWPTEVDQLSAVITSPPFFDSTRFYLSNWMRLWFCGWEVQDFRTRPNAFVDERQKRDFAIYEPVLRQARERLAPSGVVVLHLGLSAKADMARSLASVARPWFRVEDVFVESVVDGETHGIRDKGTVFGHQYLVLSPA